MSGSGPAAGNGISWYDILGVLPGVSADKIRCEYDAKTRLLRPEAISGAPSTVVKAATRAQGILDAALRVLGDPVNRGEYDEAAGFRRSGGGLAGPVNYPSEPGAGGIDVYVVGGRQAAALLGALMAIGDSLVRHPRPSRRVDVPDVRGLFYSVCLQVAGRQGLQATAVRLTEHPMPVDGLVVDQSPRPPATANRGSALTVQVWHPPMRPVSSRPR